MVERVSVDPKMLLWALKRVEKERGERAKSRFPKIGEWTNGDLSPTWKQLEDFAKFVYLPVGYLLLSEPPDEKIPITDFRTLAGKGIGKPSPNLLDIIYICQQRQYWYQEFAQDHGYMELDFVNTAALSTPPEEAARSIRDTIAFNLEEQKRCETREKALRLFINQADKSGILVMAGGRVMSNGHRFLDPEEFRGFALADRFAPLVFINGKDSKAAQMFTLAHELAHIWLGSSGLSNTEATPLNNSKKEEIWCNRVAAELLVPLIHFKERLRKNESIDGALRRLSREFKVSTLVILRRMLDADWLNRANFEQHWKQERNQAYKIKKTTTKGALVLISL